SAARTMTSSPAAWWLRSPRQTWTKRNRGPFETKRPPRVPGRSLILLAGCLPEQVGGEGVALGPLHGVWLAADVRGVELELAGGQADHVNGRLREGVDTLGDERRLSVGNSGLGDLHIAQLEGELSVTRRGVDAPDLQRTGVDGHGASAVVGVQAAVADVAGKCHGFLWHVADAVVDIDIVAADLLTALRVCHIGRAETSIRTGSCDS